MALKNHRQKILIAVIAVLVLNLAAIGLWLARSGYAATLADVNEAEKTVNVAIGSQTLSGLAALKSESGVATMAASAEISLENYDFSQPINVNDGKDWDLNRLVGGSLLPLSSEQTYKSQYNKSEQFLVLDLNAGNMTASEDGKELLSLNQKFIDSQKDSRNYQLAIKMRVSSGQAIIGLSGPTKTAYSEEINPSDSVQTVTADWSATSEKPTRVFIGSTDSETQIDLFSARLLRPATASLTTVSIGGSNVGQFSSIIPKEVYFYRPKNSGFEETIINGSAQLTGWQKATTNLSQPPPAPTNKTPSESSGATPVQSDDSPPPPPPVPTSKNPFFEKASAANEEFLTNSINLPRANKAVSASGQGSLYFRATNAKSSTSSPLIDFTFQLLTPEFQALQQSAELAYELNADVYVTSGKVVVGMANLSNLSNKVKFSPVLSAAEESQHVKLAISKSDIKNKQFNAIVAGNAEGLAKFYLDNVYLKITSENFKSQDAYIKYQFAGTSDNQNWTAAKLSEGKTPQSPILINQGADIPADSQFIRIKATLYSQDPNLVPGIESLALNFEEKSSTNSTSVSTSSTSGTGSTSSTISSTSTTSVSAGSISSGTGSTGSTSSGISTIGAAPAEEAPTFSRLVATGGVLWFNLLISMALSGLTTWLIFRRKKLPEMG